MKLIIAFIALVCSTAAFAETQTETTYLDGKWRVQVAHETESGNLGCDLRGMSREGWMLINVNADDDYMFGMFVDDFIPDEYSQTIDAEISIDHKIWNLSGGNLTDFNDGAFYTLFMGQGDLKQSQDFIRDFMNGNRLSVENAGGESFFTVYLQGSANAIRALERCRVSISPSY
jgi:hypothetical protein